MALINCPECRSQISDKAEFCPRCGLPRKYFPANISSEMSSNVRDASLSTYGESAQVGTYSTEAQDVDSQTYDGEIYKSKLTELKGYFDTILHAIDPEVQLDKEQRIAVIADDKYCLLIAGAGAGKTMTMAAKVKYLIEKEMFKPEDIIVISYTNKAIDELKERINKKLNIPVKICTFHSFGFEIIRNTTETIPIVNYTAYKIIFDYLEKKIFDNKRLLLNIVKFLGYYFDLPDNMIKFNSLNDYCVYKSALQYETIKSRLGEYILKIKNERTKMVRTITGEFLRSYQEVQIANFLYLHNVDYEYEKPYSTPILGSRKMYTPDFYIKQGDKECYIEHYGINENFQSTMYSEVQLGKYKLNIIDKRKIHRGNQTDLIETWSEYNDKRPLLEHLREELLNKGFTLTPRDNKEVYKKLTDTSKDKYVYKLIQFLILFIERFKTCGYDKNSFTYLREKTDNVRTRMFLEIAEEVYLFYQATLKEKNQIDFADMINYAEIALNKLQSSEHELTYKYIIIDEFQDIARQRFNLTKTLSDVTGAKVMAVGDDWQSIFAFAGSDITLFQKFLELMGDGKSLYINHTYRNSQELIDIAGNFIQKNQTQINKKLKSPKKLRNPVVIRSYDDTKNIRKNQIANIEIMIGEIVQEFGNKSSILIIGRYNFDESHILDSGLFYEKKKDKIVSKKYPNLDITFLTAHASKGLGFDNVIIANMLDNKYGFPSQIEDDPIMKLVTQYDYSIEFSEERRLFYVALTRTKNRVYLNVPRSRPSRFVLELIRDYKIPYPKDINMEIIEREILRCPVCTMPLRYENNKNYGIPLYMCTNEPELCDFMTNDKIALADIYKCPKCKDGYMIVKKRKNDDNRFYGCTNYGTPKDSCNNSESIKNYKL